MIKDSGERTEFSTGAVRDMKKGKGRMDLLPWYGIIEVSKHCEEGAIKYGEHNVDKGIPLHSLIDSASRHLAKFMCGETDEDHLRAAAWNILYALNQRVTHPELNDLYFGEKNGERPKVDVPIVKPMSFDELQKNLGKSVVVLDCANKYGLTSYFDAALGVIQRCYSDHIVIKLTSVRHFLSSKQVGYVTIREEDTLIYECYLASSMDNLSEKFESNGDVSTKDKKVKDVIINFSCNECGNTFSTPETDCIKGTHSKQNAFGDTINERYYISVCPYCNELNSKLIDKE